MISVARPIYRLDELLAGMTPEAMHEVFDWGPDIGGGITHDPKKNRFWASGFDNLTNFPGTDAAIFLIRGNGTIKRDFGILHDGDEAGVTVVATDGTMYFRANAATTCGKDIYFLINRGFVGVIDEFSGPAHISRFDRKSKTRSSWCCQRTCTSRGSPAR